MVEIIQIGQPPIDVHLRRSLRARRFSLRISNTNGEVRLTVPKRASAKAAIGFAAEHEGWLRRHLSKRPEQIVPVFGGAILLDGAEVVLQPNPRRTPLLQNGVLAIARHEEELGPRLRGYLKTRAREHMIAASERYAREIGHDISRITLRDTRSRWGSCTSDGNLMFSWRLIMAPRTVQDYVAAHEVCHLVEMNHSPAYWRLVGSIFPDYQNQRNWLKINGGKLHRYVF